MASHSSKNRAWVRKDGWESTRCDRVEISAHNTVPSSVLKLNRFSLMVAAHSISQMRTRLECRQQHQSPKELFWDLLMILFRGPTDNFAMRLLRPRKYQATKAFHCKWRESELFRICLDTYHSSTKQINQSNARRHGERMILYESLFNVSKCIKRSFPARSLVTWYKQIICLPWDCDVVRQCFFPSLKPSYLYPNLTAQLDDRCLSVGRDKAKTANEKSWSDRGYVS